MKFVLYNIRTDDNVSHKTYAYAYDAGGNRTSTKIYDFTLETPLGEPTIISQTYGFDSESNIMRWNDRLKTYNGQQIIYDLEGNPVSYSGKTLEWYGKQLKQVTAADGSFTQYDYDANGLRTQKRQYKADGTKEYTVDYVWSDGKIAVQSLTYPLSVTVQGKPVTQNIKIDSKFIYCDDEATPSAIMLANDEYLLVRNLQGDVVAVVNAANGESVVEFSYDPWGNVTRKYSETFINGATDDEMKLIDLIMSALCPVTYRGYNYDFTTGLYYLQSRYYNPEWGRFLNTDDTSIMLAKTDDAFSANMYLYCNNNPVNNVDYDGYNPHDGSDYKVRVNIYDGVAGHSELVIACNMIFSYGIYGKHGLIDNVVDTQGRLLLIYNEYKWYLYDKEQNNRGRTGYTFYLNKSNYIKVLIYYIAIVLQSDIEPSELGYIDKCIVKEGKYATYKLLETNCTTIIRDALLFGAPEVVLRACYMSGLSFSGFTEVYKPSILKLYVEAMGKYC